MKNIFSKYFIKTHIVQYLN